MSGKASVHDLSSVPSVAQDQLQLLQLYVDECVVLLMLSSWIVTVTNEPPPEPDCIAYINHSEQQNATLFVAPDFWTAGPERQRLIIAHELCHLPLFRLGDLFDTLPPKIKSILDHMYDCINEETTERFARMVAPRLPLPQLKQLIQNNGADSECQDD